MTGARSHIVTALCLVLLLGLASLGHATEAPASPTPSDSDEVIVDDTWGSFYVVVAVFVALLLAYALYMIAQHRRATRNPMPPPLPHAATSSDSPTKDAAAATSPETDPDNPFAANSPGFRR